jgi:ABC-type phosphate transport system ATPase subunit
MTEFHSGVKMEVRGLHFYYGSNHALKNINIAIRERQITKEPGFKTKKRE